MIIRDMSCCAVQEIAGLSHTGGDSHAAMRDFCKIELDRSFRGLYTMYIFTGVLEHTCGEPIYGGPDYGPNFAKFIKEHGLGEVVAGKPEFNRVNHPTHLVQGWIWTPDVEAVKAWWSKNKAVAKKGKEG